MKNRKFAWELFKTTGNIDAYMILKDIEYSEEMQNLQNISKIGDLNGAYKDQRDSYKNS